MPRWVVLTCLALAALQIGCETKRLPPRSQLIDRVDVVGAEKVDGDDIAEKLATSETKHIGGGAIEKIPLLTVFDAMTVEYHTFDRYVLERDLERVRRYYRARGFYDAEVRAGRVVRTDKGHVRVEIEVDEGLPVLLDRAELDFPEWQHAFESNAEMQEVLDGYRNEPIEEGEDQPRFDEEVYDKTKLALVRALTDHGFAYAEIVGHVSVDVARRRARVKFQAKAGPRCTFGPVRFEGLGEIPEDPVRRALSIEPGTEFSTDELETAQRAVADLQVFAAVEIQPERSPPGTKPRTVVPLLVRVQPVALRAVRLGVGAEVGSRIESHAIIGWEDRNFVGGLRRFAVEVRPGLVLFPTRVVSKQGFFAEAPTDVLPQAELRVDFKQPSFPEARTNLLAGVHAVIERNRKLAVPDEVPEDFNIVGKREIEGELGLERKFHFLFFGGNTIYRSQLIKLLVDNPFSYNFDDPPTGFETLIIPYLDSTGSWDFRKGVDGKLDSVRPHSGLFFALNMQVAHFGSAEDFKLSPDIRAYAPITDKLTLAFRWATGFLWPRNYGESIYDAAAPVEDRLHDLQIMTHRGLFSGGPRSNRGYNQDDVGPYEKLPNQLGATEQYLHTGGLGLWELSAELRIPIGESVGAVVFIDSSDVVRSLSGYRFTYPHISPGLGLRAYTPVGVIRFDIGVRVPYLQKLGTAYMEENEGGPPEGEADNFPLGIHFAIGEAY